MGKVADIIEKNRYTSEEKNIFFCYFIVLLKKILTCCN